MPVMITSSAECLGARTGFFPLPFDFPGAWPEEIRAFMNWIVAFGRGLRFLQDYRRLLRASDSQICDDCQPKIGNPDCVRGPATGKLWRHEKVRRSHGTRSACLSH